MIRPSLGLLLVLVCRISSAQFYPDSSALWCVWTYPFDPGYGIQLTMSASPDTIILDQTYKKVTEHADFEGEWTFIKPFYVRNGVDGKGYMFLLDSMAEYITGDVSSAAGDTVHDVLLRYDEGYVLRDVVVDSVVTLTNEGVEVVRHYVDGTDHPSDFWQSRAGAIHGPCLNLPGPDGYVTRCIIVNDTSQFGWDSGAGYGLPGGPLCCVDFALGTDPTVAETKDGVLAYPNPSTGLFKLNATQTITVAILDSQGRLVLRTRGQEIDLSGYAPGLYTALVQSRAGRQAVRLVVER